ncbi:MAG: hypothetical protein ABIR18_04860 [Chitinophagaceae bacterium]
MRVFLLLLVLIPVGVLAQINRSANELARESVQTYLTTKIYKDQAYNPGSYSELKPIIDKKNPDVAWMIQHKFEIDEVDKSDKKNVYHKPYKFAFYLDKKMMVLKAEAAYLD